MTKMTSTGGFEMSDSDKLAVDQIKDEIREIRRAELKRRREDITVETEKEPSEKRRRISKLVDFAIVASLCAEVLVAVGWIL